MANTSAPVGGSLTTGVFPNRSNTSAPDLEQKKREQARDETRWARGLRSTHPSFTRTQYDVSPGVVGDSNRDRETAQAAGEEQ